MTGPDGSASSIARDLVACLAAAGVTDVMLAPGSRSAPVALALHAAEARGSLRLHVRVDEREAGFLALGLAKVARRPVPVVTTSGTAVANLHPAVLEALHAGVRVVAVTADRPARLRGTGANQTTVQPGIFPGVTCVEDVDALARELAAPTVRPVQLNLELDEPIVAPVLAPESQVWSAARSTTTDAPHEVAELERGPRTVVLAGDDAGPRARQVAEAAGWPLLAEPTSGARTGPALPSYRLLLAHAPLTGDVERVVCLGHPTLSRPVTSLLARADVDVVHVGTASTFPVPAGPRVRFVDDVTAPRDGPSPEDDAWRERWRVAEQVAADIVTVSVAEHPTSGLAVASIVARAVPPGGLLVVGASQVIRDLDLVSPAHPVGERRLVIANRGLAGIDGVLSTAIGAALARDSSRALAVVGDLTFLHGSNGLLIGPDEPRPDLTIVVVNDDGGAIFSTLEQGAPDHADAFERVFGTPTGADLAALCTGYGVPHRRVGPSELAAVLQEPAAGLRVVEVPVSRDDRRALDVDLRAAAAEALEA
ncbi:2-succinyl-5-enolpyruvyl-6-hydroxy-3-cyclohexene- 1-carboxylic-acid synthase [Aeromicrobium halocynthiae]|uniref:2-succinyl-5-enolpyruvyl-6-hydroxy-3-cyclohexene-1-carboxylate synthase n=1 Tax=Aeromicrobium halocynthiae TaxID=560557 RepID=A0ABN2W0L3_9ACTN